jgi:2-C-methyl-D-erythritol 4-phosphate cytidylyltransferase/2-C-methyl-D-erythritol 2,4-cyclodiphosphate synthase
VTAVVVAAGRGERLGVPAKVLLPLAGRPLLAHTLDALERAATLTDVIVVVARHTRPAIAALLAGGDWPKVGAIVDGGERRQDSMRAGLAAVDPATAVVVVHDGARPLASAELFDRCVAAAVAHGAAIAAVPVADTLKRVVADRVVGTVDRTGLWAAQTPQAFRRELLVEIGARWDELPAVTDEAGLCEALGVPVAVVPGSPANLKVTHPVDIAVADALLRANAPESGGGQKGRQAPLAQGGAAVEHVPGGVTRVGIGYDAHRIAPDRRLVLGGVAIDHPLGLSGHSDADVALHAIADALLGAAGLGDIGIHFPPADPRFQDADSRDLLREVGRLLATAGFVPVNVDVTIVAEAPRIGPHVAAMRAAIAGCLGLRTSAIGVKATTNEGMGFVGREEGIAALATAAVVPLGAGEERP